MARLIRNEHDLQFRTCVLRRFETLFDAVDERLSEPAFARTWESDDSNQGHDEKLKVMDWSAI
jgi:hypothetical protein